MITMTIQDIRRSHGITMPQLAEQAGVTSREVYLLEIGASVPQEQAQRIVATLAAMTGEHDRLPNVGAPLTEQPTLLLPTLADRGTQRENASQGSTPPAGPSPRRMPGRSFLIRPSQSRSHTTPGGDHHARNIRQ